MIVRPLILVASLACGTLSLATERRGTAGPYVSWEQKSPGAESISTDTEDAQGTSQRSGTSGKVMAPVRLLDVMLIPQFSWNEETRKYSKLTLGSKETTSVLPHHSRAFSTGIVAVATGSSSSLVPFAIYNQLASYSTPEPAGVMHEYYLGTNYRAAPDVTITTAARIRRFPYVTRVLPVVGFDVWLESLGVSVDILYPSHALIRFQMEENILVSSGIEIQGRDRPYAVDDQGFWIEGYTATALISVAKPIWKVLYGEWSVGAQQEKLTVYSEDGETRARIKTDPAPWVRVALRTYFAP